MQSSLLIVTIWSCLFFALAYAHGNKRCGHSHVLANITTINRQHFQHVGPTQFLRRRSTDSTPSEEAIPRAIRVHVDYQLNGVDPEMQSFLVDELVPAAVSLIESTIQVKRPIKDNLQLPRYCTKYYSRYPEYCLEMQPSKEMNNPDWAFCGHAVHNDAAFESYDMCSLKVGGRPSRGFNCERHNTPGIENADLLLYVTAVESPHCEYAASYALYCSLDIDTQRPLAGSINFCPSSVSTSQDSFDHQIEIAVHELLHTLVFTESLFDKFIYENGTTLPLDNVVKTSIENDRVVKKIVTPKVVQKAREHFGCPTLDGAELEDEGGSGTAGSHWETRTFQGELMDGMSGVNIVSDRHALSPLTLALLEDSGWYVVNWDNAGSLEWGRGAGCSFAEDMCDVFMAKHPEQEWFCDDIGVNGCTSDLHAYGQCQTDMLLNQCNVVLPFNNMDCKQSEHRSRSVPTIQFWLDNRLGSSVNWGVQHGPSSYCLGLETPMVHRVKQRGRIVKTYRTARSADCYKVECDRHGTAYVDILDRWIPCDDTSTIELNREFSQFISGGVQCPDSRLVCPTSGCPDACSGRGWCHRGQCHCHLGYTGDNCSTRICNSRSTYCLCQLFDGRDYGRCQPGTENFGRLLSHGPSDEKDEYLKISISIKDTTEEALRSVIPSAISQAVTGVDASDVHILNIVSASGHVTVRITTYSAYALEMAINDSVLSGDLSDALSNHNCTYVEGSFYVSEIDETTTSRVEDDVDVTRAVIILVAGIGSCVFVLIVGIRAYFLWRRLHRPPVGMHSYEIEYVQRHPLASQNPFSSPM